MGSFMGNTESFMFRSGPNHLNKERDEDQNDQSDEQDNDGPNLGVVFRFEDVPEFPHDESQFFVASIDVFVQTGDESRLLVDFHVDVVGALLQAACDLNDLVQVVVLLLEETVGLHWLDWIKGEFEF